MGAVGFYLLSRRAGGLASGVPAMADLMPFLALAGAGIGFMFSPAATDMVNRVAEAAYGEATSISQTMKNLGGALGMAALSSLSLARFAHGIWRPTSHRGRPPPARVSTASRQPFGAPSWTPSGKRTLEACTAYSWRWGPPVCPSSSSRHCTLECAEDARLGPERTMSLRPRARRGDAWSVR